jgi:hypothetical protein
LKEKKTWEKETIHLRQRVLISKCILEEVFVKGGISFDMIVSRAKQAMRCTAASRKRRVREQEEGGIAQISLNRREERAMNME